MRPTLRSRAAAATALPAVVPVAGHAMGHGEGVTIVFEPDLQDMASGRAAPPELRPMIDFARQSDGDIEDVVPRGEERGTAGILHATPRVGVADRVAMFGSAAVLGSPTDTTPGFARSAAQARRPVR